MKKGLLMKLIASALIVLAPSIVAVNACTVIYGETKIPESLKY